MVIRVQRMIAMIVGLGGLALGTELVGAAETPASGSPPAFFERLVSQARESAQAKYQEPTAPLPDFLKNLSYDAYMGIHFRPDKGLWHGQPGRFQVQFFHPGYLYREPVRMHVLEDGQVREVQFSTNMFDYGQHSFPHPLPPDLFLAGLRVLYPLNQPAKMDEVAVFLGTSFFRVLGAHQDFGSSARGLAIDTAETSGEEFPRFTKFWIEKPGEAAEQIRMYARLESPRVAGAYQFLIKPGEATLVDIKVSLFLRSEVKKLGLAPLTSMYFFGENRTRYFPDFRPEVHDADGLLMETAQQSWDWRPLINPPKVHHIGRYPNTAGFGLLQRDREWDDYQDLEAHFERRPSYWIAPVGNWGTGHVELVEIPTTEERNDNMVAYWVPDQKVSPGQEFRFHYQLRAFLNDADRPPAALMRVRSTRLQSGKDGRTRFVVDFTGGTLTNPNRQAKLEGKVQTSKGKLENVVIEPNPMLDGWRAFFDLIPDGDEPAELRLWLRQGDRVVSETWVYHFTRP